VRRAAIEAISKYRGGEKPRADYHRIAAHTGKYKPSRRRRPKALDPRLLRAERRRDPLAPSIRGRVSGTDAAERDRWRAPAFRPPPESSGRKTLDQAVDRPRSFMYGTSDWFEHGLDVRMVATSVEC